MVLSLAVVALLATQTGVSFKDQLLEKVPDDLTPSYAAFSPTGTSAACIAYKGSTFVIAGGKKLGPFEFVRHLMIGPDGTLVYEVKEGQKHRMIVGDKRGEAYDSIRRTPIFSPDGKTLAYAASRAGKPFMVVGEKKSEEFDVIGEPVWSPDSATIAFSARKGYTAFVFVGDKKGKEYDEIADDPVFSPDGKKVAYAAQKGSKWFLVINEEEMSTDADAVAAPAFRRDGTIVTYAARRKYEWSVVENGKWGDGFKNVGRRAADEAGGIIAYATFTEKGRWSVFAGGKSGEVFDRILNLVSAPKGDAFAYVGENHRPAQTILVVGDSKSEPFEWIGPPAFSPDGKKLAYRASREKGKCFVTAGKSVSDITDAEPLISHWGDRPDYGSPPIFSPDGEKVAFGVCKGRELWWKVLDVE